MIPKDSKDRLTHQIIRYDSHHFATKVNFVVTEWQKPKRIVAVGTILVETLSHEVNSFVGVEVPFKLPTVVAHYGTCSVGSLTLKVYELEQK